VSVFEDILSVRRRADMLDGLLGGEASGVSSPTSVSVTTVAPSAAAFQALIVRSGVEAHVDPALIEAVIAKESAFQPRAVSSTGAQGLMQLMPATAAALGVSDPYDPAQNVRGGARYLRSLLDRFGGDVRLALAAYNAGPGAVERYDGIPPYAETQAYVGDVLSTYEVLRRRAW
jgi:soluble lytic murein transglycosylase-like protein